MHLKSIGLTLALCGATSLACDSDFPADQPGEVSAYRREIIDGFSVSENAFNAAIYHFKTSSSTCGGFTGWQTRPCSGTVLKRTATETFVLTARHCVTKDGNPFGPLVDPGTASLRVSGEIAPGPVPRGSQPPASAIPGEVFAADTTKDLAIVRTPGTLYMSRPGPYAIYRGSASALNGAALTVWGYGRFIKGDECDGDVNSGAGTLRTGRGFSISNVQPDKYTFIPAPTSTQEIWHGDSGGGSFLFSSQFGYSWLTGVHSGAGGTDRSAVDYGSGALAGWIEQKLGNLYLRNLGSFFSTDSLVGVTNVSVEAPLFETLSGDSPGARIAYDANSQQMKIGGLCLRDNGTNVPPRLATCSTSTLQKWAFDDNSQIRNVGSGRCLRANGSEVWSTGCGTSASTLTQWVWMSEPKTCNQCLTGDTRRNQCNPTCGASICAVDPYCCNVAWDSFCVAEVTSVCHLSCN